MYTQNKVHTALQTKKRLDAMDLSSDRELIHTCIYTEAVLEMGCHGPVFGQRTNTYMYIYTEAVFDMGNTYMYIYRGCP